MKIKALLASVLVVLATSSAFAGPGDAEKCVKEVAKATSDCIKGSNKECKAGIDKVFKSCVDKPKGGGSKGH